MSAATVARLKITLDYVKPTVLRRVEVPFDIRLDRLHLTIQAAMGWTNSHPLRSTPAMSAGVRLIPIRTGPATSSMHAKLDSAKYSKTSERRR
jgi:hypothetical protein